LCEKWFWLVLEIKCIFVYYFYCGGKPQGKQFLGVVGFLHASLALENKFYISHYFKLHLCHNSLIFTITSLICVGLYNHQYLITLSTNPPTIMHYPHIVSLSMEMTFTGVQHGTQFLNGELWPSRPEKRTVSCGVYSKKFM